MAGLHSWPPTWLTSVRSCLLVPAFACSCLLVPARKTQRGDLTAIVVDADSMLARRKMSVGELAEQAGITPANLAALENGRAKAVRFTTSDALCKALDCQPGNLLRREPGATPS